MTKVKRNPRVFAVVSHELNDKLVYWAQKLGVSKSVLIALCVFSGLNSLIRAISPEELLPAEKLVELIKLVEGEKADDTGLVGK